MINVLSENGVIVEEIHEVPWNKCCATVIWLFFDGMERRNRMNDRRLRNACFRIANKRRIFG